MVIRDLICAVGRSGYFNKDLAAIKAGPKADGFAYRGSPATAGFEAIIQPGEAVSVMLILEDGQIASGDCVDVILAGIAGRDPVFRASEHLPLLQTAVRELLRGRTANQFMPLAREIELYRHRRKPLHTALRSGLSQALLHGAALANRKTIAEVIALEYGCHLPARPVPMLASCLTHYYDQLDRMIMKRADLLPDASFHIPARDLGQDGTKLLDYGRHLARRARELGGTDYRPRIHLDVYGTMGELFEMHIPAIADYLGKLKAVVAPLDLPVETPVLATSKAAQIDSFQPCDGNSEKPGIAFPSSPTNGAIRLRISGNSPMLVQWTTPRSRPRTWAASATRSRRSSTAARPGSAAMSVEAGTRLIIRRAFQPRSRSRATPTSCCPSPGSVATKDL